ncbi:YigZ family protein [Erysipelotrichaceae bacterium HCN-30851]
MYRLKKDTMAELEIKKSRFLCYLHKSFSESDAKEFIQSIKKMHPNARHHCYAFIIGEHNELQRSNDDGEPQGTAGVPMLECLANRQMQDIVAVTVRYFGGIKLGAGGLIRAYSKSVSNALDEAIITQKQKRLVYKMEFSYELIGKLDHYFRQHNIVVLEKEYEEQVIYTLLCKEPLDEDMSEISNGRYLPEFIEERIVDVEI